MNCTHVSSSILVPVCTVTAKIGALLCVKSHDSASFDLAVVASILSPGAAWKNGCFTPFYHHHINEIFIAYVVPLWFEESCLFLGQNKCNMNKALCARTDCDLNQQEIHANLRLRFITSPSMLLSRPLSLDMYDLPSQTWEDRYSV